MSLQKRLLRFMLAVVGLLFGLYLAHVSVGIWMVSPELWEAARAKTDTAAVALAGHLDVALAAGDVALARALVAPFAADDNFLAAEVHDPTGMIFFRHGTPPGQGLFTEPANVPVLRDETVAVWRAVEIEGVPLGRVGIWHSTRRLSLTRRIMQFFTAATVLIVIATVVFAVRFARGFVAPLREMMAFSHRVADGVLEMRLETEAHGELGQLVGDLNAMAEGLASRDRALVTRQRELEESLAQLRAAREELIESTRLASVGEMAGRTAHEVLNPITGIHGRLTKLLNQSTDIMAANLETMREIASGWREDYSAGGLERLSRSLSRKVAGERGERLLVEEDIENLLGIQEATVAANESRIQDLRFLLREVERVTHIVDGMRSLTRRSGTVVTVPFVEILEEAREVVADSAAKRCVTVEIDGGPEHLVHIDRSEAIQVITNLMRNALQSIEEKCGRAGGRIGMNVASHNGNIVVRVRDTGLGIPSEHLPFIFESSFTTRSAEEGTGLGLSISRRLARRAGGELTVERTTVGEGTTFRLQLPGVADERNPDG